MEDALLSWPGMVVLWTAMPGHFAFRVLYSMPHSTHASAVFPGMAIRAKKNEPAHWQSELHT
jgi:hypothetical protein